MAEPWSAPPCPQCGGAPVVNVRYPAAQVPVRRVICLACGTWTETPAPDLPPWGARGG